MKLFSAIAVLFVLASLSATAAASETKYSDRTEYSFDDDVVIGDLMRPDDADIVVRRRGKESSLITVRQDFVPELLKSVEDI